MKYEKKYENVVDKMIQCVNSPDNGHQGYIAGWLKQQEWR